MFKGTVTKYFLNQKLMNLLPTSFQPLQTSPRTKQSGGIIWANSLILEMDNLCKTQKSETC